MENLRNQNANGMTSAAFEKYCQAWESLSLNYLFQILDRDVILRDSDMEDVGDRIGVLECHDVIFKRIIKSELPYLMLKKDIDSGSKGVHSISKIEVSTPNEELLFSIDVTHDNDNIHAIDLTNERFLELISEFEQQVENTNQPELF